jgi:DnaJ-class molecular chaperone
MQTPYQILSIEDSAGDVEIKQAYLQKVKDNPPDYDQEQFQLIHNAYLAIKDPKSRMNYALFNLPIVNFDELINQALSTKQSLQISPEHFIKLLSVSIDETTFLKAIPNSEK